MYLASHGAPHRLPSRWQHCFGHEHVVPHVLGFSGCPRGGHREKPNSGMCAHTHVCLWSVPMISRDRSRGGAKQFVTAAFSFPCLPFCLFFFLPVIFDSSAFRHFFCSFFLLLETFEVCVAQPLQVVFQSGSTVPSGISSCYIARRFFAGTELFAFFQIR